AFCRAFVKPHGDPWAARLLPGRPDRPSVRLAAARFPSGHSERDQEPQQGVNRCGTGLPGTSDSADLPVTSSRSPVRPLVIEEPPLETQAGEQDPEQALNRSSTGPSALEVAMPPPEC